MLRKLKSDFRFCFRQIQAYLSIIQEYIHTYSEPSLSLVYLEPRHIQKFDNIQISVRHIVVPLGNSSRLQLFLQDAHSQTIAWWDSKYAYVQVLLGLHSYCWFCFRHIQTYSGIIQDHIHAYLELSVSLAYLKPWDIPITKYIQTLRYTHNTILNIFTKAQSWTFDANLNAPLFYICYLTYIVTLHIFAVIFQNYLGILKTYSAIFSPFKAC